MDFFQCFFDEFDFATGFDISFQEMAFTLQSAGHVDGVSATLDGTQQMQNIDSPGTRHLHHLHIRRITQTHGPGQIAGCISAVLAAIGDDLGFKGCIHCIFPFFNLIFGF